jgi:phospholipid transport system substrate-binding protein
MRSLLVKGFIVIAGYAGWAGPAHAGFLSVTSPVIVILGGDLFVGEAERRIDGSGSIRIQASANPALTCHSEFPQDAGADDVRNMRCSDGVAATYQFRRLGPASGYGTGSTSRGPMSFTFGLDAAAAAPYLALPAGKILRREGVELALVNARPPTPPSVPPFVPATVAVVAPMAPPTAPSTAPPIVPARVAAHAPPVAPPSASAAVATPGPLRPPAEAEPDMLLSAATLAVAASIKQNRKVGTNNREHIDELLESTVLPLFDFRLMTQLAMANNWRRASPEQQGALITEYRMLLVRTYSTVLDNFRDQVVAYKPLHGQDGLSEVTVKSTVDQPGSDRMTIDYDMAKTPAGWKVYDVKIAGIGLATAYRSSFAEIISAGGVDELIRSMAARNRLADAGFRSGEADTRATLFMYGVLPQVLRIPR